VFSITSSIGLPLEIILDVLTKKGLVVDWRDYFVESLKHGSKESSVINKIESAIGDCFGSKYREEVSKRLKILSGQHI
jgi:alanyl-tRNA synthetase